MRSRVAIGVMSVAMAIMGCATGERLTLPPVRVEQPSTPLAITRVGVKPKTLDLDTGELAQIRYEMSEASAVMIHLVDEEGRVARELIVGPQSAGFHEAMWDGRDQNGRPVASGVYRYLILARNASGAEVTYDPSRETGGEELTPREFSYDRGSRMLRWVMPRAGFARLRVGLEGFPHLRTLLDWEPLEAGRQELSWDGLDASGFIQLKDHPNLSVKLAAYAMPDNTIIVRNSPHSLPDHPLAALTTYPPLARSNASYLHARHHREQCHEVRLRVEFPEATQRDGEGRPVLSGAVPVRVTIHEDDAIALVNSRFELALFEDLTILFEEEEATTPFTFVWDTSRLPAGQHLLTVNVLGYDDHFGVTTQPVMIEPRP